jgi:hypothetical protein
MARKKTTGAELAPRPRGHRSLVTKRDLQAYRRRLEAELAELHGQLADREGSTEAGPAEVGLPGEPAAAGFTFQVEHALARIDAGSFGRCQACGGAIEAERLDALPYATLCLADARQRVRLP